ncbi:MAG: hypothetical protein ALECFALPRED_005213 [Alectoria fallacina]|uniref:Uncharacterized protein n=1 Tax=Alectoria fallacina TaxID=1903189 RepID=A0A8H3FWJ5_9LECA|nr:MAG: hypothetical protein ALECFALPRED_005213 [Alectoria fallacina]
MPLNNSTQIEEPSSTLNASSSTITSLSSQQGSQWGPSGIGTVVFGCVASILAILALWMMFWLRQREPGQTIISGEELGSRHSHTDITTSDDDVVALGYLPLDGIADPEAVEGHREDAEVNTQA